MNPRRLVQIVCLLSLPFVFSCAQLESFFITPASVRTVHVKVVADPSFANNVSWRTNAGNLIVAASGIYESWFNIRFVIDTMLIWSMDAAACHGTSLDQDCLVESVPRGNSDIVIFFAKEGVEDRFHLAGLSYALYGYIFVTQGSWVHNRIGYDAAYMTLVHELGHLFGAVHIYKPRELDLRYVMNPYLTDKLFEKDGMEYETKMPDFHPATVTIINALRDRPFTMEKWAPAFWPKIRNAYQKARGEYCNFRMQSGMMRDYESNDIYQNQIYFYLSNWASACGQDSLALAYCDSMDLLSDAMAAACRSECHSRMCADLGCSGIERGIWTINCEISYRWLKSYLLLRAGKSELADAQFDTLMVCLSGSPIQVREQFRGSYRLYKYQYRTMPAGQPGQAPRQVQPASMEPGIQIEDSLPDTTGTQEQPFEKAKESAP